MKVPPELLRPEDRLADYSPPSWIGSYGHAAVDDLFYAIECEIMDRQLKGGEDPELATVDDVVRFLMREGIRLPPW